MNRSIIVYAVLLLGSLGWAYQTWTHEDELELADKVVIAPGSLEDLDSLVFRSKELELTVTMKDDEQGRFGWARAVPLGDAAEPPEPPPTPEGQPPPPTPPAPKPLSFKVGKGGETALEAFAPFVAKRRLEGISDEDVAELGFDDPMATLEITRQGKEPRQFELGSNVFGGANVYVRDPADGAIYIVEARVLRSLHDAARSLPNRDLTGITENEVERVSLRVGDRQATFAQHNPDDAEASYWSVAGETDKSAEASAWVPKVLRMRASAYVQEDEAPVDLQPAFDFAVQAESGDTVSVEVLRAFDDEGNEQFFGRSSYTRGLVRIPRVSGAELSADLETTLQAGGA